MDEATRARLKAYPKKQKLTARNIPVADWIMATDAVKDVMKAKGFRDHEADPPSNYFAESFPFAAWGASLKYVSDEVIEALAKILPCVKVRYTVGPNRQRETCVFPSNFVVYLLHVLSLDKDKRRGSGKYMTGWDSKGIARCRIA